MDLRRLRAGEWIAGLGGAALLASLFMSWYPKATGWESLAVVDLVLAALALVGILLAVLSTTQETTAIPIALAAMSMLAGLMAAVLVLFRVLDLPEGAGGREAGAFVALAGALAMLAGGYAASRDERITGASRTLDPADVEKLPAPQANG
jgi:hypothetical protein